MKRLSNKQLEIINILKEKNTFITFMKGLHTKCYIHDDFSYNISISTMFSMEEKGILEERKSEWNSSEYHLTEKYK